MPALRLVGNLWTLSGHPHPDIEWPLARKIAAIKTAGFDAVTGYLDEAAVGLARMEGLDCVGFFWATDFDTIAREAARHRTLGVELLTVFLGRHDTPPDDVLSLGLALADAGKRHGLYLAPETHRDTGTETPEKTTALLASFRQTRGYELPITWDFSHPALVKHLARADWPDRLLAEHENIRAAKLFHFRPFNGQHAQLPVRVNGRRIPEYEEFLTFFEQVIQLWKSVPENRQQTMWVCPELGPVQSGYSLSHELPPWDQAKILAEDLREVWNKSGAR